MTKSEIFRALYASSIRSDEFIDSIPSSISAAFFDNEYTNELTKVNEMLIPEVFGDHTDSIMWFLHEWKSGYEVGHTLLDGQTVKGVIHTIDEYIEWMEKYDGFTEDMGHCPKGKCVTPAQQEPKEIRCSECGYLTKHTEHIGCLRKTLKAINDFEQRNFAIVDTDNDTQPAQQEPEMVAAFRSSHAYTVGFQDGKTQAQQEPVAWMFDWHCDGQLIQDWIAGKESEIPRLLARNIRPLYTLKEKNI